MTEKLAKGVDHVTVQVSPAEPLFNTLVNELLLPTAWPLNTNPFYTSGGVHLGNINLEIRQTSANPHPARLYGLAFESQPFEESLPLLAERGIPHTPPHPFVLVDEQGWQETAWRSVYLGGLLGDTPLARVFFAASQRASEEIWERASLPTAFNRRYARPFVSDRVFPHGLVSMISYNPAWKAYNIKESEVYGGLELVRVCELVIGVKTWKKSCKHWSNLITGFQELDEGLWQSPEGMNLRLVKAPKDGFQRMIWQVKSLNRAAQFLHKRKMLGPEKEWRIAITPERVSGLDIQLVQ